MKRFLLAAAVIGLSTSGVSQVQAQSASGVWRCKTYTGNLPIGILTISGASYRFVVATNTTWRPVPNDPGNGSGAFVSASDLTPRSGPLRTQYGVVRFERGNNPVSGPSLFFANAGGWLLTCWPQGNVG